MSAKSEQLSRIINAFELWCHRGQTPTILCQQADLLLGNYASSKIISALKLSGIQLKPCADSHQTDNKPELFVYRPLSATPQDKSLNLQLHFAMASNLLYPVIDP